MGEATNWLNLVIGAFALLFAFLAWRVSKKELQFAQQQAARRPRLRVTLPEEQRRGLPAGPLHKGSIVASADVHLKVENVGQVAASNLTLTLEVDKDHMEPLSSVQFALPALPPSDSHSRSFAVKVLVHGPTWIRYTCTYLEGTPDTGTIEFVIPKPE